MCPRCSLVEFPRSSGSWPCWLCQAAQEAWPHQVSLTSSYGPGLYSGSLRPCPPHMVSQAGASGTHPQHHSWFLLNGHDASCTHLHIPIGRRGGQCKVARPLLDYRMPVSVCRWGNWFSFNLQTLFMENQAGRARFIPFIALHLTIVIVGFSHWRFPMPLD